MAREAGRKPLRTGKGYLEGKPFPPQHVAPLPPQHIPPLPPQHIPPLPPQHVPPLPPPPRSGFCVPQAFLYSPFVVFELDEDWPAGAELLSGRVENVIAVFREEQKSTVIPVPGLVLKFYNLLDWRSGAYYRTLSANSAVVTYVPQVAPWRVLTQNYDRPFTHSGIWSEEHKPYG